MNAPIPTSTKLRCRNLGLAVLLVGAIVVAFFPALRGGFIWDDDAHVTANACIVGPLGFREIWTTPAANYFPLVLTSFWAMHALWGLDPGPYHAFTLMCHALTAVLLWRVLARLGVPGAWVGALLWSVHPVQVESVAWISELKNTQSAIFFLLSVRFYLGWIDRDRLREASPWWHRDYGLALGCALLAMLSKPSTVMLPVILALLWWWRTGPLTRRDLAWLAPFFALSLVTSGWTIWEQKFNSGASGAEWNMSPFDRLAIAGRAVWFYLGKLIWPHPLVFIYPRWEIGPTTILAFVPGVAFLGGLAALWRLRRSRWRPVLLAAACFVALLFPVLGFFDVYFFRFSFVGDHFQYLASMAPLALGAAGLTLAFQRLFRSNSRRGWLALAALPVGLGSLTWRHCGAFASNEALWQATLTRNPVCWLALTELGEGLARQGRFEEAGIRFEQALHLNPSLAVTHNSLGVAYVRTGRPAEALRHYREALRLDPFFAVAHNNLGGSLLRSGQIHEAGYHFRLSLQFDPKLTLPRINLGNLLLQSGRVEEAVRYFRQALQLQPGDADLHLRLGNALFHGDRLGEAITAYEHALQLAPNLPESHNNLGAALLRLGKTVPAIERFQQALRLRPGYAEAATNLSNARAAESAARTTAPSRD